MAYPDVRGWIGIDRHWQRRYHEEVITPKSQHTDLQWHFDLLRRFAAMGASLVPSAKWTAAEHRPAWIGR